MNKNTGSVIQGMHFEPTGKTNALVHSIERFVSSGAKSLLIMSCDNDLLFQEINSYLQSVPIPVFGGIFPKIVYQKKIHGQGSLIISFNITADITVLKQNHTSQDIAKKLKSTDSDINNLFIFADGYMQNIDQLLTNLYEALKPQTSAIGAGCGVPALRQKPCLFSNFGLLENALIVASMPTPIEVSTAHGLNIMTGPYLVTKSENNIVYTLNHKPALQVYKDAIKQNTGQDIDDNAFYDVAKTYPLGLDQLDNEILVRDPISINEDALVCVGSVPVNSSVYILKGETKQILHAAGQAAFELKGKLKGNKKKSTFFLFDGISRASILGDELINEISLIRNTLPETAEIISALSLGEISLNRNSAICFHNKSVVIGSLS